MLNRPAIPGHDKQVLDLRAYSAEGVLLGGERDPSRRGAGTEPEPLDPNCRTLYARCLWIEVRDTLDESK